MEYLTGGAVKAGMHEVVITDKTLEAAEEARRLGRPVWRVSSTLFAHVASDQVLQPLHPFSTPERQIAFPAKRAGDQARTFSLKATK
eukprot:3772262-Pleurochrysis_carterae.AAC.3